VFDEGKIKDYLGENDATLTYNTTLRHMTDQVKLQTTSVLSPMLSLVDIGETFVLPISNGEGRLYMKDRETLERYIKNGQVVMQYLDPDGHPTNEYNGSMQ
jgi:phosphoribosylformylglycinamidine synthase